MYNLTMCTYLELCVKYDLPRCTYVELCVKYDLLGVLMSSCV